MQEVTSHPDWLAACVGAVVAFGAGWLWYSPWVFGGQWAAGLGVSLESKPPIEPMLAQIAGLTLLSMFIAAAGNAPGLVLIAVAAFLALGYSGDGFAGHPRQVRLINAGYLLLASLLMLLVQALL